MTVNTASVLEIGPRNVERHNADVFERVRLPLASLALHDPQMLPLLEYYSALREGGLLPRKSRIDPAHLKPYMGRLHFVDTRAAEAENYRFTMWGSSCHLDGGTDYTNLVLGEYPSQAWQRALAQDYMDAVKFGTPAYHLVSAIHDFRRYQYSRLILPLSENGRDVTHLLVHVHKRVITEFS